MLVTWFSRSGLNVVLRQFLALALCAMAVTAQGRDCEALLVPDFALPGLDTTTDLSYLAVVSADNFSQHRANAYPMMSRVEVQLPIARELLRKSHDFAEFSAKRDHEYAQYQFNYAPQDLITHFRHLLPVQRFNDYNACTGSSGLLVRLTRVDRDFVDMAWVWHPPNEAPGPAPLADLSISGATLLDAPPPALDAQGVVLHFARNLDVDLRVSADLAGTPQKILVPRFIAPANEVAETVPCTGAKSAVRAIFRQTLGRDPRPAELAAQAALLDGHRNSVRQLVQRNVLGAEYQKTFVGKKPVKDLLKALYRHVFARDADESGLNSNAERFANAAFPIIAMTFLESHEYQSRFGDWAVPGSPPSVRYCAAAK